jgi:hypothetical protein
MGKRGKEGNGLALPFRGQTVSQWMNITILLNDLKLFPALVTKLSYTLNIAKMVTGPRSITKHYYCGLSSS